MFAVTPMCNAAADPFAGTWVMNVAQSKYASEDLPRRMVIVMEAVAMESAGGGVHYRSETTRSNGAITTSEYTATLDGMPTLVKGDAGLLAPVTLHQLDANTIEAVYVRGLKAVAASKRVLSGNGEIMTITTTFKDKLGKVLVNVGVYQKARAALAVHMR